MVRGCISGSVNACSVNMCTVPYCFVLLCMHPMSVCPTRSMKPNEIFKDSPKSSKIPKEITNDPNRERFTESKRRDLLHRHFAKVLLQGLLAREALVT